MGVFTVYCLISNGHQMSFHLEGSFGDLPFTKQSQKHDLTPTMLTKFNVELQWLKTVEVELA